MKAALVVLSMVLAICSIRSATESRRSLGKRHFASHPKQVTSHQLRSKKQSARNLGTIRHGNLPEPRQTGSNGSIVTRGRMATPHTLPVRPVSISVRNSQQLQNARTRGSRLASIGGPANSKSTTAISGADFNRKPK
jgi:hypothetical protein